MANAISAAGTFAKTSSQTLRTLSVNPTAVGNVVFLFALVESTSAATAVSAVSGGNCTGWTQVVSFVDRDNFQCSIWMGKATATGAANITVTTSAGSTVWVDLAAAQFTCANVSAGTQWQLDGTAASRQNTVSSTTINYPTLVPSDTGRMYLGWGLGVAVSLTTGQTAGYTVVLDDVSNAVLYNTAVTGTQSPTSRQQTSQTSSAAGFLVFAGGVDWAGSAGFSGAGSLGAAVNQGQPISTGFSGAGSMTTAPTVNYGIAVTLTGGGSMSATGVRVEYIAFTAQGSASILAADVYRTQNIAATFAGTSHLSAAPGASGAASMSASGSMTVGTPQQDHAGKATWSAGGSLTANGNTNQYIGASFAGTGQLTAAAVRQMFIGCTIAGASTFGVDARRVQPTLASFSAAGHMLADPLHTALPTMALAGTGLLTIDATALGPVIGHWNAPPKGIPVGPIGGSLVFWRATLPGKSTILVETSVDNGASWQVATNGAPVPRLPNNSSIAKAVLTRVTLTRGYGADPSPRLHQLEIRLGVDATRDELCPLGVFTLNDTVINDGAGGFDQSGGGTSTTTNASTNNATNQIGGQGGLEIEISGSDLSRKISRNLWDKTYVIDAGTNYGDAIKAVITDRLPGTTFNFVSTDLVTPRLFFGEQSSNDPWQDAMDMAEACGCWLFFDARGVCVMRPEPDPDIDPAVWTFRDTANPVITQLSRKITDQDTYNYVIVTGESSANDVPARGTAIDDDPSSPTYYLGPYGTVTYRVTTPLVSDDNQALTMAQALLRKKKGATETVEMDVVPNAALEPGDVVGVERSLSKITGRFSLDGYSIPLGAEESMHLVTRRQRI